MQSEKVTCMLVQPHHSIGTLYRIHYVTAQCYYALETTGYWCISRPWPRLTIKAIRESPVVGNGHPGGATCTPASFERSVLKYSMRYISVSHE